MRFWNSFPDRHRDVSVISSIVSIGDVLNLERKVWVMLVTSMHTIFDRTRKELLLKLDCRIRGLLYGELGARIKEHLFRTDFSIMRMNL